jgi:SAM-dependent methyltransferase
MYEKFTDAARAAMQAANHEAQRVRHDYIGTDDILIGLMVGEANFATQAITSHVSLEEVRQKLAAMPKVENAASPSRAKKIVEQALTEARAHAHLYIGTEHLILGVLHDTESDACRALQELGLDLQQLKADIAANLPPGFPELVEEQKRIQSRFADHPQVLNLKREIKRLQLGLEGAVAAQNFAGAASFRDERRGVEQSLAKLFERLSKEDCSQRPRENTTRFSDRVENYVRYRPGYPNAVVSFLRDAAGLTNESIVADIGSGTGISTKLFLDNGNTIYAVEPNREMREAAERLLASYPSFHSVDGAAEATTLADKSVDLIIAGQAFHWFDRMKTRQEFARILRLGGWVVLMWNSRGDATPFAQAYEALLMEYGTDYQQINHRNIDLPAIREFFAPAEVQVHRLPNEQVLDFDGLRGRILSCSYVPTENQPRYAPMLSAVQRLFDDFEQHDKVRIEYDTELYLGQLS